MPATPAAPSSLNAAPQQASRAQAGALPGERGPITRAVRGHVVVITADPFAQSFAGGAGGAGAPTTGANSRGDLAPALPFTSYSDGAVLIAADTIVAVGDFATLAHEIPAGVEVDHFPGQVISAGFVDTHTHYAQTDIVASYGAQLIEWLATYTFPEEQRFVDPGYASAVAGAYFDQLVSNGTTTALAFCTSAPESVDAFFAEAAARNMRVAGGKVLMDRNAPGALCDTAEGGYRESAALIERWHGRGRAQYAVTPRFAPTSTPDQLAAAAALLDAYPGVLMHTHVSENRDEIEWVQELFPDARGYLDVYDRAGLLRPGAVLAHGVHLSDAELARVGETGAAIAHCPTSNLFLGSGLFDVRAAAARPHSIPVGLGTDIGAGTSFSLLATMGEAYKVAQLRGNALDGATLFYLATLGGARALGLDSQIGSLEAGKEADIVVLDPCATELLARRTERADSLADVLFALALLGDDRAVSATYAAGEPVYRRSA